MGRRCECPHLNLTKSISNKYRYCLDPEGEEVFVSAEAEAEGGESSEENQHCHFHAGVEYVISTLTFTLTSSTDCS